MKKKLLFITLFCVLFAGILCYLKSPNYLIFNSVSTNYGSERDTELQVIIYKPQSISKLITEIEAEHNKINGTPSTLTINLHHSKRSFKQGRKPFYRVTINYPENQKADSL